MSPENLEVAQTSAVIARIWLRSPLKLADFPCSRTTYSEIGRGLELAAWRGGASTADTPPLLRRFFDADEDVGGASIPLRFARYRTTDQRTCHKKRRTGPATPAVSLRFARYSRGVALRCPAGVVTGLRRRWVLERDSLQSVCLLREVEDALVHVTVEGVGLADGVSWHPRRW